MPAFTSFNPAKKFACRGMCLNRAIDTMPDGKYPYLQNVRSYTEGEIQPRSGLNQIAQTSPGSSFHSGYTLNNFNPSVGGTGLRFLGYGTTLMSAPITMPTTPSQIDTGYSGDPLSMVAFNPKDNPVSWVYVYDSNKQRRYTPQWESAGLPIPFRIGLEENWIRPTVTRIAGALTGDYYYRFRFRDPKTGVIAYPATPTYSVVSLSSQSAQMTMPSVLDPTSTPYIIDIFRFGGAINNWNLVGSAPADGSTVFTDTLTDTAINSALTLDTTRFRPWITQDIPQTMTGCTITAAVPGTGVGDGNGSIITATGGNQFNTSWLPGTPIIVNNNIPATLIRWISTTSVEVQESLTPVSGATVQVIGALKSNTPLPYAWGTFGAGQFGLYAFAVGDVNNPGKVYWTNGNDLDSTNPANSLDITDPSEPLMNGCIYNGISYVWSTERMWQLVPDLTNPGQFVAQVLPGNRGLFAHWGFAVGDAIYFIGKDGIYSTVGGAPTNITDEDLYDLLPKDGSAGLTATIINPDDPTTPFLVYSPDATQTNAWRLAWGDGELFFDYPTGVSGAGVPTAVTLIYTKFPTQDGLAYGWLYDIYSNITTTGASLFRYWETDFRTLIVGYANSLYLYNDSTGTDGSFSYKSLFMTPAYDLGDPRELKLIGDVTVDYALTIGPAVTFEPLANYNTLVLNTVTESAAVGRTTQLIDVNSGAGVLSKTCGLLVTGNGFGWVVYQWSPYWVPKPEVTQLRATDWTDDGLVGSKYLKALVVEANVSIVASGNDLAVSASNPLVVSSAAHAFVTSDIGSIVQVVGSVAAWKEDAYVITALSGSNAVLDHSPGALGLTGGNYLLSGNRTVQVQYDGGSVATTINLAAPGQTEMPYVIPTPVVCREMRLLPTDANTCEIFKVRWVWDPYPEYLPQIEDYSLDKFPGNKYVRGVAIEGDSQGTTVNFSAQFDGGNTNAISIPGIVQNGKTLTIVSFSSPFIASEIRLIPLSKWRRFSVRWIADDYPDYAALLTPIEVSPHPMYRRGLNLHADTQGQDIQVGIRGDGGVLLYTIPRVNLTGQDVGTYPIPAPFVSYATQLVPSGPWRWWESIWNADPYPDLSTQLTPIMELGTPAPKFIQGVRLTAYTNNLLVVFRILFDGGSIELPPTAFNGKVTVPFSWPPFIAHNIQIQPLGPAGIFLDECEWIWEPVPDLAKTWVTQQTDHDLPGFHSLRDGWVAYQSAPGATQPEILTIATEYGSNSYNLPPNSTYARPYVILAPQKARWRSYTITSSLGVRLFVKDTVIRAKQWDGQQYQSFAPFGDLSRNMGARI